MKKLVAIIITLCIITMGFAACANETSGNQTAEPTQQVENLTAEPTAEPTEVPTEEPTANVTSIYEDGEIEPISRFLDGYSGDRSNIYVWKDTPEGKRLQEFNLDGVKSEVGNGKLFLYGFDYYKHLEKINISNCVFDELVLDDCASLQELTINSGHVKYIRFSYLSSCNINISPDSYCIKIDYSHYGFADRTSVLTLFAWNGYVGMTSEFLSEEGILIKLSARPYTVQPMYGDEMVAEFIGWYNQDGELVSKELEFEFMFKDVQRDLGVYYTAVFDRV